MKPIFLPKYAFGVLLMASVITACKKGTTSNTEIPTNNYGSISYTAKASGAGLKTVASVNSQIKTNGIPTRADSTVIVDWASASVYVDKISFTGQSNNLLDTTIAVEKNLNIFNATALAGVIKLPVGSYKNVTVKLFGKKSAKSELAFNLRGTFTNAKGIKDSIFVASSFPFVANVAITDIVINPFDNYTAVFNFDLNKVLTGITTAMLETANSYTGKDNKKTYSIFKGGSADVPYFNQVIANWQTVTSVTITKGSQ